MNPANYRARLLQDIFQGVFIPFATCFATLHLLDFNAGQPLIVASYGLFMTFWAMGRVLATQVRQRRQAAQLGARHIPRVSGKWPGNLDILLKMLRAFKDSYLLDVYRQLFEEYQCTTLNVRILWVDNIISMDQEHAKFVLTTGFPLFWRGRAQKERFETFLGRGIFNRDDDEWKAHRTIARPFFARDRISDFEIFEKHASRTLAIISSASDRNQPCEAQDLYARFSLDTASEFLFGRNVDTLSADLPVPGKTGMGPKGSATDGILGSFTRAFETAQLNVTARGRIGYFWPVFEFFKDKNTEHAAVVQKWLDPLVELALEAKGQSKRRADEAGSTSEKNFLQHLADSTNDPILIRDQLLSMLLASRDTTATSLTFMTYFMAMYPEVTEKLRAEALSKCGPDAPPTIEQLKDLKYMRAFINETLRLFPPVPLNTRESRNQPCAFPSSDPTYSSITLDRRPLYMPSKTTFTFVPMLTHRNPALWGPDAEEFVPERWLDPERIAKFVANPTMYMPFSAGPRICVGQQYAYNEMSYFLVRLLQRFDTFTLATDVQPRESLPPKEWKTRSGRQAYEKIWPAAALTAFVKGGLWVKFGQVNI